MGKKDDNRLKSDSETIHIMVKYLSKQYVDDDMKKYVDEEGVEVHSVETVSNPNAKSFRIEIPFKDKDGVTREEFWPSGISLKVWRPHHVNQGAKFFGRGEQQRGDANSGEG